MRRLKGGPRGEKGAVATLVTVLVASGVVMGMLALSVDVGNIMFERRQLQNATDATSMALAQACAKGQTAAGQKCASAAAASAALKSLANANSKDGRTLVPETGICGSGVPTLPPCTSLGSASNLRECNPINDSMNPNAKYVETRTYTESATGATVLPQFFSQTIAGASSVTACARAAWGPAGNTGNTIPMVATRCFYDQATANGTQLLPAPPYVAPDNVPNTGSNIPVFDGTRGNYAWAIEAHDNQSAGGNQAACPDRAHNGQTYPGGFAWVNPGDGTCSATFNDDGTLTGRNGAPPPQPNCTPAAFNAWLGKEVFIPIASSWTSSGTYTIDGIASFYFAGYENLGGGVGSGGVYNRPAYVCTGCNGSSKYIWGWFTSGIKPVGSMSGGGSGLGASIVAPAG